MKVSPSMVSTKISKPKFSERLVHHNGNTFDIINTILYADSVSGPQTKDVSTFFNSGIIKDTCHQVWSMVRHNIKYVPDRRGHEKVQSPAMLWHTKRGDCKSFSIFIGSILKNLNIPYWYRFVKYQDDRDYTHVYVVAGQGKKYILDAVHTQFNEQLPFKQSIDFGPMTKISYIAGPSASESTLPAQPMRNWFAMTQGELRLSLVGEQLDLLSAGTGDPTGEYAEAKKLIQDVGTQLHYLDRNVSATKHSNILGITARHINAARRQNKGTSHFPFIRGTFRDEGPWPVASAGKNDQELYLSKVRHKDMMWGRTYDGPIYYKGTEYRNWDSLFMDQGFDCEGDIKSKKGIFDLSSNSFRHDLRSRCRIMKTLLTEMNERYEKAAPQCLYQFAGNVAGKTSIVDSKMLQHKIAVERFSQISGISHDNMILWTRNGVIRQFLEQGYQSSQPEEIISAFRKTALSQAGSGVNEPVLVVSIILAVLTFAVDNMDKIRQAFQSQRRDWGDQLSYISTESASPNTTDWTGVSASEAALPLGLLALGGFFLVN